jgi:prepilin-type N-terminal cleavage/methylation domain-containing protein
MRRQAGFTLIELIAVMVILGIVAVFAGFFLSTGMRGNLMAQQAQENAQRGQIALQRIALELRDVNGGPGAGNTAPIVTASSIRYTSSQPALGGTRTLAYNAGAKQLRLTPIENGEEQLLLDKVASCTMSSTGQNTEHNILFTVTFTLDGTAKPFSITVKPRHGIPTPVSS